MRILLIEDDTLIGDGICAGLKKLGFTLDWFTDGQQGENALTMAEYDAVILDLSLPKKDGLQILKQWRQQALSTPVIILTARDAIEQRVTGLQSGADDYLCKPFALTELAARLQALIRRSHQQVTPELTHLDITFNPETQQVKQNGNLVILTSKETRLLELFMLNANKVLSRELIQDKLYSWSDDVASNTVDVYIHNLRKKLGNNVIKTVYGSGYILGNES
ncbi:response regulator [Zophobihabitans entericus]|uniref:Response regulator n=1 Tax=Zophobihabitans entericus TaxID=1635327 RepID=A0A6G9I9I9_9GAMM|nr:response regulator [Zophobihabitans entericus]QIQ20394.1 response regulator [Zophobihabitans entericus]